MSRLRGLALWSLAGLFAFAHLGALAAVPPSADWVEVQRYNAGAPEGPFHMVYLIPNGSIIYLVRFTNFAKASASPITILQSLDLLAPVPLGRAWLQVHRWEKNPPSGEGDVQFEATYAIPIGSTVHFIRVSNLNGIELEKLPNSPITLK